MTEALITIGITAYNAVETIEAAIVSAKAQDWQNTEIVVVDDCSSDGTWEKLQALDGIRIFQNKMNRGVAVSRNRIVVEAKGDFIAFFDDDDISTPERIKKQVGRILEVERQAGSEALVLCHTARTQIYPDGTKRYEPTLGCGDVVPFGEKVAKRILYGKPFQDGFGSMPTCSQMARTSTYRKLGGFDEDFRRHEDTELNIRAALAGAYFAGIAEPLVTQTMTMSADKNLDIEKDLALRLLEKHRRFLEQQNQYAFSRAWVEMKFTLHQKHEVRALTELLKIFIKHPFNTVRHIIWSLPNIGFNLRYTKLHQLDTPG